MRCVCVKSKQQNEIHDYCYRSYRGLNPFAKQKSPELLVGESAEDAKCAADIPQPELLHFETGTELNDELRRSSISA